MLRGLSLTGERLREFYEYLAKTTTINHLVMDNSPAQGKTLRDFDLRQKTGTMILTVVRDRNPFTNPGPDFKILAGDLLVLLGSHAQLDKAERLLSSNAMRPQ